MLKNQLSENEIKLFTSLGLSYLFETPIPIKGLYQIAVEKCFIDDMIGPVPDALRRGFVHIVKGGVRGNRDFENLVEIR